jgi:hypothetical protein
MYSVSTCKLFYKTVTTAQQENNVRSIKSQLVEQGECSSRPYTCPGGKCQGVQVSKPPEFCKKENKTDEKIYNIHHHNSIVEQLRAVAETQ